MSRLTVLSIAGMTLLLSFVLACGTLALAVRMGIIHEQLHWFPPNSRYQVIVRVGRDALPWDLQSNRAIAINVWVHGRGTGWHIVRLLRVPLGQPIEQRRET